MITETVSGRRVLRYRGEPIAHDLRFTAAVRPAGDGFGVPVIVAFCEPCGWRTHLEGVHTAAQLTRRARQHAGLEDPPEGTTP